MKKILILSLAMFSVQLSSFAQGSLTPPGAPAPTMKTLDQVEPRTPITTLPFTITQGGSYYLTKSFVQNFGNDALVIKTNNVTVDLCGFTIQQTVGSNIVTGIYISPLVVNTPMRDIVVKNGCITGFTNNAGIDCRGTRNCVFENLSVTSCGGGFSFQASGSAGVVGNVIRHCRTCDNVGASGILILSGAGNVQNVIEDCESLNNGTGFAIAAAGNLIINSRASGNTGSNYTIAAGNREGTIVLPGTNPGSINGSSGGVGSGTTDPFANLSY